MITLRGVAFIAIAGFTFLLARLTQVGWLYLLDAMLWGAITLSAVMPWLAVMSLSARRRVTRAKGTPGAPGPAEGDTVEVELCLENGRMWPRYLLSVSYQCPLSSPEEGRRRYFVPRLDGGTFNSLVTSVRCHRRGPHQLGPVQIESKAPFGLFRRRVHSPAPLSVLVYPKVYPLHRLPLWEGMQGTAARPRRTPLGQEVAGSRHYLPGDPLRHIHWRNTARQGRPMVKEFEDTQENTLVIVFDSSRDVGQGQETVLEYSIKLAASVAGYVTGHGGQVRVVTGGVAGQEVPWTPLLKELALLETRPGPGLPALLDSLQGGARVLALVSETDSAGMAALVYRSGRMDGLTAVALEGFGEDSYADSEAPVEKLRRAGVPVISCHPDELPDTLRSLDAAWSTGPAVMASPAIHRG